MAIKINAPSDCCGCTACASVCRHAAITMQADATGFVYPLVDADKCVECGLCEKVCQFKADYQRYDNFDEPRYYAMRCLDTAELDKSQSGGAFFILSQEVLSRGGIVYGAALDKAFRVEHQQAETAEARDRQRGSKYVQSSLEGIFQQIKEDMRSGRQVLFSGTPCQCAGLRSFFGRRQPDNLFTVDLLCHGVTSPLFWAQYLAMISKMRRKEITEVRMRDKSFGWLSSQETYLFGNEKLHKNTFYALYYAGHISRPSCFACPFVNTQRVADITIGDYHGWNQHHDTFTDNTGVSLAMANSAKGMALIESVQGKAHVFCEPTDIVLSEHVALTKRATKPDTYDIFWQRFQKHGAKYVCKKYSDMAWRTQMHIRVHKWLTKILPR